MESSTTSKLNSSGKESHQVRKLGRELLQNGDSERKRNTNKASVLAPDTEEDRIYNVASKDPVPKVVDSYVPETEECIPIQHVPKELTVPESLVPDTQESSHKIEGSEQPVPDSFVPDSELTENKIGNGSSHIIPDSFVPESLDSQGTVAAPTDFEIDTIPDSQGHLSINSTDLPRTVAVPTSKQNDQIRSHKPRKKTKSKKGPMKLFDQLQFSSDSSFDNGNPHTFVETFCVDKTETFNANPFSASDKTRAFTGDTSDINPRLLKILNKNTKTKEPKKLLAKDKRTKNFWSI